MPIRIEESKVKKAPCRNLLVKAITTDPYLSVPLKKKLFEILGREYVGFVKRDYQIPALKKVSDLAPHIVKELEYDATGDSCRLKNCINHIKGLCKGVEIEVLTVGTLTHLILNGKILNFKGVGVKTVQELIFKLIVLYKQGSEPLFVTGG